MSKVDERYKRGKIYCLRSHQTDLVYIGSTIQGLAERIGGHRSAYRKWLKGTYYYVTSFEIIKYDDAYIELVEDYPCKTKAELERREGQVMRDTDNCCNKVIVGRTSAEYYQENKDKITEYRAKNKDRINEKQVEYYYKNKDKIAEQMAEYRAKNKDKFAEYRAEYYVKNKEKLSEKVQCDCGSKVRKSDLTKHLKTKKHQKWVDKNSE